MTFETICVYAARERQWGYKGVFTPEMFGALKADQSSFSWICVKAHLNRGTNQTSKLWCA